MLHITCPKNANFAAKFPQKKKDNFFSFICLFLHLLLPCSSSSVRESLQHYPGERQGETHASFCFLVAMFKKHKTKYIY